MLRQLKWLKTLGYKVSFIGFGDVGLLGLLKFFKVPVSSVLTRYLAYLLPNNLRFRLLYGRHISEEAVNTVRSSDLVIINELELIPAFCDDPFGVPIYLDLHENHVDDAHHGVFELIAFKNYWKWQTQCLKTFVSQNRTSIKVSTVESAIAQKYANFFSLPVQVIYNSPLTAKNFGTPAIEGQTLRLVHLGMARKNRGVELILSSLRHLNRAVSLDLMVIFAPVLPFFEWKIKFLIFWYGLGACVHLKPPVSVEQVVEELTQYDISLVIGSNATDNDLNSLPNKFFQSLQAGLMIICGPNPAVKGLVADGDLGIILSDWHAKELSNVLQDLSIQDLNTYKRNSEAFAPEVSESRSERTFYEIVESLQRKNDQS